MKRNSDGFAQIWLVFIGFMILTVAGTTVAFLNRDTSSAAMISELAYTPTDESAEDGLSADRVNGTRLKQFVKTLLSQPVDTTELDSQIATILNNNSDIYISVAIKDLRSGSVHNYGKQEAMTAASVTKVLTAVDFMKEVELGHKSLEMILANGYSAQENIEQMIVYSDNNAWHTLNNSLTYSQMQSYAESIGLLSYNYVDNSISAADITRLLADTYQRKLINESNTQLLLSYMERANFRDLIVPAVPEFDTVYHKAGWLESHLNDATIITNGNHAIVLTIFTDSITSYDKARISAVMQQITTPTLATFRLDQPPITVPQ